MTLFKKGEKYYLNRSNGESLALPEQLNMLLPFERNEAFIYFIKTYITEEDKAAKNLISEIYPSTKKWSKEHFQRLLGEAGNGEYSDADSDDDQNDINRYPQCEIENVKRYINRKHTRNARKNFLRRANDIVQKIKNKTLKNSTIAGFSDNAKQRRGYFAVNDGYPRTMIDKNENCLLLKGFNTELDILNYVVQLRDNPSAAGESLVISNDGYIRGNLLIENHLHNINYKLKNNYFLPMYRGISYLVDRWERDARRSHRRTSANQSGMHVSESILHTLEEKPYEETRFSEIDINSLEANARLLSDRLVELRSSDMISIKSGKGETRFKNFLDALQYSFSNGIVNFLKFLGELREVYPGILQNDKNPFLPFSHIPYHALRYAFGEKEPYSDFALAPLYDANGKPRKPYVGMLIITVHPLSDIIGLDEPNFVPYLGQTSGIQTAFNIASEWEVSFLAGIPKERIVLQRLIRFPSFHSAYQPKYLAKYGLTKELFYDVKNIILNGNVEQQQNAIEFLKAYLIMFYSIKASEEALYNINNISNAVMLYRQTNGSFSLDYPEESYSSVPLNITEKQSSPENILRSSSYSDRRIFQYYPAQYSPKISLSGKISPKKPIKQLLSSSSPCKLVQSPREIKRQAFAEQVQKLVINDENIHLNINNNDNPGNASTTHHATQSLEEHIILTPVNNYTLDDTNQNYAEQPKVLTCSSDENLNNDLLNVKETTHMLPNHNAHEEFLSFCFDLMNRRENSHEITKEILIKYIQVHSSSHIIEWLVDLLINNNATLLSHEVAFAVIANTVNPSSRIIQVLFDSLIYFYDFSDNGCYALTSYINAIKNLCKRTNYCSEVIDALCIVLKHTDPDIHETAIEILNDMTNLPSTIVSALLAVPKKKLSRATYDKYGDEVGQESYFTINNKVIELLIAKSNSSNEIIQEIVKLINNEDSDVCNMAIEVLSNANPPTAEIIFALLDAPKDKNIEYGEWGEPYECLRSNQKVIATLNKLFKPTNEIAKMFIRGLSDKDAEIRQTIITLLSTVSNPSNEIIQAMITCSADNNFDIRRIVAKNLIKLSNPTSAVVRALLKYSLREHRQWFPYKDDIHSYEDVHHYYYNIDDAAIKYLTEQASNSSQIMQALVESLNNEDIDIRQTAVETLGNLPNISIEIEKKLEACLNDNAYRVRHKAATALSKRPNTRIKVIKMLTKDIFHNEQYRDWGRAVDAIKILSTISNPSEEIIQALVKALEDKNLAVRDTAIDALGNIQALPETALAKLINLFNIEQQRIHVKVLIINTLAKVTNPSEQVKEMLNSAASNPEPEIYQKAIELQVTDQFNFFSKSNAIRSEQTITSQQAPTHQ